MPVTRFPQRTNRSWTGYVVTLSSPEYDVLVLSQQRTLPDIVLYGVTQDRKQSQVSTHTRTSDSRHVRFLCIVEMFKS